MNALQTIRTAIARRLSTTTALTLLALTLAVVGTAVSLQSVSVAPLGGDCLYIHGARVVSTGNEAPAAVKAGRSVLSSDKDSTPILGLDTLNR